LIIQIISTSLPPKFVVKKMIIKKKMAVAGGRPSLISRGISTNIYKKKCVIRMGFRRSMEILQPLLSKIKSWVRFKKG